MGFYLVVTFICFIFAVSMFNKPKNYDTHTRCTTSSLRAKNDINS
jgi:hypothetical protein